MAEKNAEALEQPVVPLEEVQREWLDLKTRVGQLEGERTLLEKENKMLRLLMERVVEHRQRSHSELILLLTNLVSKLPINDAGIVVAKLVEHNANVAEVCAALSRGSVEAQLPQPTLLQNLEQGKRAILTALQKAVDELLETNPPLEPALVKQVGTHPESFFAASFVRATRCFVKGQLPRERVLRDFGAEVLEAFTDLTTDPKFNPKPKPDEIVLGFKPDFEATLRQLGTLDPAKRNGLLELYRSVQLSRGSSDAARQQRVAYQRVSFLVELWHYYQNQATEAVDVIFAQRLPALLEQLALVPGQMQLEEQFLAQVEGLLAFILHPDHRLMVINNMGKGGGLAQVLKFVLRLRAEKLTGEDEVVHDFVRALIPPGSQPPPLPQQLAGVLKYISDPARQKLVVRGIMATDRMKRIEAELLGRAVAGELGLKGLEEEARPLAGISPEVERQIAWGRVRELVARRAEPGQIATAIRDRLHARYESDEVKESWIVLSETEPIAFIRVFCQLPYLADGKTDAIARAVLETYVTRLMHEKYAVVYAKVMHSLKNMFKAKADSPTLLNFVALVKWVDAEAARRLSRDIGLPA